MKKLVLLGLCLVAITMAQTKHSALKTKVGRMNSPSGHSVQLSWTQSDSTDVTGNNVYRGTISGGPYSQIYSSSTPIATYTDSTVTGGTTYYYVVTATCTSCDPQESGYSNEAQAVVPNGPPDPPTNLAVTGVQ